MVDIWDSIVQLWEYSIEHVTILAAHLLGFDPTVVLPWAQLLAALLAIFATSFGLLNFYNHFGFRKRQLLAKFLTDEEHKILERKPQIAQRFLKQTDPLNDATPLDVHASLDDALELFDAQKIAKAEQALKHLFERLNERQELASRQVEVATKQKGAVNLFLGAIAASGGRDLDAIKSFRAAIDCNAADVDAHQYLTERYLARAKSDFVSKTAHLADAMAAATAFKNASETGSTYNAEALNLQGEIFLATESRGNARTAFEAAASIADQLADHRLIAKIYENLGLARGQAFHVEARRAFDRSRASYVNLGNDNAVKRVDALKGELSEAVSSLNRQSKQQPQQA